MRLQKEKNKLISAQKTRQTKPFPKQIEKNKVTSTGTPSHFFSSPKLYNASKKQTSKVIKHLSRKERLSKLIENLDSERFRMNFKKSIRTVFTYNKNDYWLVNNRSHYDKTGVVFYSRINDSNLKWPDSKLQTQFESKIRDCHFAREKNDNGIKKLKGATNRYELKLMSTGYRLLGSASFAKDKKQKVKMIVFDEIVKHKHVNTNLAMKRIK